MKMKSNIKYVVIVLLLLPFLYSLTKSGYPNSNLEGEYFPVENIEFLYDLSYTQDKNLVNELSIFDEQMNSIYEAEKFIILDLFLFNDEYDKSKFDYRPQVEEMTNALIDKKKNDPNIDIIFITDQINNFYGAYTQTHIKRLIDNGIDVNFTNFDDIRDSNPLYSGLYSFYIKWLDSPENKGWIKNIFDPEGPKLTIRSFLRLLNFKANHRKVLITDKCAIVSSSNPHDPSSKHSNVAIRFESDAINDLIKSELDLIKNDYPHIKFTSEAKNSKNEIRILTESKIYKGLKENIDRAKPGDSINIAIFYISDRKLLKDLKRASERGVNVNIIADQNKDAFGLEKNGAPNRPALSEISEESENIHVRWYKTHGEQFHTKMAYFDYVDQDPRIILGSANFTRRNLQNYNLETDIELIMDFDSEIARSVEEYYQRIWNNQGGEYTVSLDRYYEDSTPLRTLWKIQEFTGLCTW